MVFRRFLGLPDDVAEAMAVTSSPEDTATVRRIVSELEAMPDEQARYLASFAYVLSRAAHADLEISAEETRVMERIVAQFGGLPEAQAVLAVEIAKSQARLHGATEDYLVTRQFRQMASEDQRLALLRCCFLVGAADRSISAEENHEIAQIASELGFDRAQLNGVRGEFREQLAVIQRMRAQAPG